MASSNQHWLPEILKNDKYVKWVFKIIITALAIFILYILGRALFGYNVKFFGNETHPEKPKNDTIKIDNTMYVHDTTHIYVPMKEKQPKTATQKFSQKIDSGGRGFQNNAPNYGNQAVGDINVTQPEFNEQWKQSIMRQVEKLRKEHDTNHIIINLGAGSNAGKFSNDLKKYLEGIGYIVDNTIGLYPFEGMAIQMTKYFDNTTDAIGIYIGSLK